MWADRDRDGEAVLDEPESAEYSDSDGTWTGDSGGVYCRAGARPDGGGLFADRTAAAGTSLERQAAGGGLSARGSYSHPDRVAGVWPSAADGYARPSAAGEGRSLRDCI